MIGSLKSHLRIAASRAVSLVLRVRAEELSPSTLGRVLVVAPHPDDESLGCGGTIARLTGQSGTVQIAMVTDGRASHPGHPLHDPDQIAAMRRGEAELAALRLGVPAGELRFLGYEDGRLGELSDAARARLVADLADLIRATQPDTILAPLARDGSSEHDRVTECLDEALRTASQHPRILEYPIWARWQVRPLVKAAFHYPGIFAVDIRGVEAVKRTAIAAHTSQLLPLPPFTEPTLPADFRSLFKDPVELFFER
ncbi:1D-myo-inositol 2-acetamido-2-deoxy-alpha-D-glucopyranoside deacetylase [mine drainage metagenome]|uniref:1D-myo-inositol 2-acetamido-2-deoxy-alpha-D-glucopyranoside deacetylase n=1 Tax=mine drainage metagenome TaxID=410659 RepID=A0A1J5STJ5_9ZZZZ